MPDTNTEALMSKFKSWQSYSNFAYRIRRQTRFIRTPEDQSFLRQVLQTSKSRVEELPKNTGLWRAQLGHTWRPEPHDGQCFVEVQAAYSPERMKPVEGCAAEGRANPKGIPVLYLSTRQETAMSEVRPWLGSFVSCAQFRTTRPLRIVDFSVYQGRGFVYYFDEPDDSEKEKAVWAQIGQAFSKPTTSSDGTADYAPTQVIAELFKTDGYDGIAYKSAFGDDGYNIALFNLADAVLAVCALHEVKSLKFSFLQFDNPYKLEANHSTKTT